MNYFAEIQSIICSPKNECIQVERLQDKTRKREVVFARQCVMYFLNMFTAESWFKIADHYGKDHATAMHAVDHINDLIDSDKKIADKITRYKLEIEGLIEFENNLKTDRLIEIKEILHVKISNGDRISLELISAYNRLIENLSKPGVV